MNFVKPTERHFKIKEVAKLWSISEKTVKRLFWEEPGVLKFGSAERRFKRGYWSLRIPESVIARVHLRLLQKEKMDRR